ncbi:MAG: hypothetical protein MUC48_17975 [Leptolyngbya sp. Prado105]|jgi:hypothetical protein|nr:hypothetical protein [Leptolyngbya sp. Prado105]
MLKEKSVIAKITAFYLGVGLIGVCVAFHPTLLSQFAQLQADKADTRFVNYVLEHSFQTVFHRDDGDSLWTPKFFFPFKNTLAFSENLLGVAPLYWIARVFFAPDLAYQWWTIACTVLCYLCFAIFLRSLRVSHILSALGGFIFGFGLVRISRLFHSQLLPQFFTPLAFLYLWQFLRNPTVNRLRLTLLFIFLQVASGIYLGWYLLFSLLIFAPLVFFFDRASLKTVFRFIQHYWKSTIVAFSVWFLAIFLLLSPYLEMSKLLGARPFSEVEMMLPRLASWIYPPPNTLWYSSLSPFSNNVPMPHEHIIFMGFLGFALAGFALYILKFKPTLLSDERATLTKICLAIALIIFGFSLYIAPGISLWKIIYSIIPGATSIRAVSRIALLVQFLLLTSGLLCLDSFLKQSRLKPKAATAIALLLLGLSIPENLIFKPLSFEKASVLKVEAELTELMNQGCDMAYVNLTARDRYVTQQLAAMWAGLNSRTPVVNGYSGAQPPKMPGIVTETLSFSQIMQWFQSVKATPTGRFCLIAATDDPATKTQQIEMGISLSSLGSKTQYFSRDRNYTAFVISLPAALPRQAYSQGIRVANPPPTLTTDQVLTLPVFVRNTSPMTWVQSTQTPIRFSYRWMGANKVPDKGDGLRTELPTVIAPESAIAVNAAIKAPPRPGEYILRLSLVHENVAWFMDQGAKSLDFPVNVISPPEGTSNGKPKP